MKAFLLLPMVLVAFLQVMAISNGVASLDCASRCWDNSKFVSSCNNEANCLCDDSEFQSAVFQCLHSQCQTAQFGSAVHSALMKCSGTDSEESTVLPHLIRHRKLRIRHNTHSGTGSVLTISHTTGYTSASRTYSATFRHATAPASGYSRGRSASLGHTNVHSRLASHHYTATSLATLATSLSVTTSSTTPTQNLRLT